MATISTTKYGNYDPNNVTQSADLSGIYSASDKTLITYADDGNDTTLFSKNGMSGGFTFTYENGDILTRTLAGIFVDLSDNTAGVNVTGGIFGDVLIGGTAADVLKGGAGNDTLDGGWGTDSIYGGGGDDVILSSFDLSRGEIHDGGEGSDTLLIAGTETEVVRFDIDLASGTDNYGNTYIRMENIIGGVKDDHFWGTAGANIFDGGLGADILEGRAGDDTYTVDNAGDRGRQYPEWRRGRGHDDRRGRQ
jgi:Ca2+-binding RTX toxin-like protein